MSISELAVPIIIAAILIFALASKTDVFGEFTDGVKDGLNTVREIFPSLLALVLCVGMLRASGLIALLSEAVSPITNAVGFPAECTPLLLLRPFSGSGAVAIYESLLTECGADSFAGRVASVILGSSETTFYTIAVYFAATKVKKTRHTLPAALVGDVTGWIMSAVAVGLLLGRG